ncbi:hypothetical protein BJ508DRAFT_9991 [Ascobolus immersus RN42]|uniref:Uncharacterized protein n=1 Tax=Ascobolus immersus RN42 TaxID=1160509 RepID=A0A3N4HR43_ASCIM|nr:hypothetical protein BJ508DRAFT_9991 [Ascobolus immersus RN42]
MFIATLFFSTLFSRSNISLKLFFALSLLSINFRFYANARNDTDHSTSNDRDSTFQILADGTQDLAALIGLFATDNVERNAIDFSRGIFAVSITSLSLFGLLGYVRALVKLSFGLPACVSAGFTTGPLRSILGVADVDLISPSELYDVIYFASSRSGPDRLRYRITKHVKHTVDSFPVAKRFSENKSPLAYSQVHAPPFGVSLVLPPISALYELSSRQLYFFGFAVPAVCNFLMSLGPALVLGVMSPRARKLRATDYMATFGLFGALTASSWLIAWISLREQVPPRPAKNHIPHMHMHPETTSVAIVRKSDSRRKQFMVADLKCGFPGDAPESFMRRSLMRLLLLSLAVFISFGYICQYILVRNLSSRSSAIWLGLQALLAFLRLGFWIFLGTWNKLEAAVGVTGSYTYDALSTSYSGQRHDSQYLQAVFQHSTATEITEQMRVAQSECSVDEFRLIDTFTSLLICDKIKYNSFFDNSRFYESEISPDSESWKLPFTDRTKRVSHSIEVHRGLKTRLETYQVFDILKQLLLSLNGISSTKHRFPMLSPGSRGSMAIARFPHLVDWLEIRTGQSLEDLRKLEREIRPAGHLKPATPYSNYHTACLTATLEALILHFDDHSPGQFNCSQATSWETGSVLIIPVIAFQGKWDNSMGPSVPHSTYGNDTLSFAPLNSNAEELKNILIKTPGLMPPNYDIINRWIESGTCDHVTARHLNSEGVQDIMEIWESSAIQLEPVDQSHSLWDNPNGLSSISERFERVLQHALFGELSKQVKSGEVYGSSNQLLRRVQHLISESDPTMRIPVLWDHFLFDVPSDGSQLPEIDFIQRNAFNTAAAAEEDTNLAEDTTTLSGLETATTSSTAEPSLAGAPSNTEQVDNAIEAQKVLDETPHFIVNIAPSRANTLQTADTQTSSHLPQPPSGSVLDVSQSTSASGSSITLNNDPGTVNRFVGEPLPRSSSPTHL